MLEGVLLNVRVSFFGNRWRFNEKLEGKNLESFIRLGAKVTTSGGADFGIIYRLGKARAVCGKLMNVWMYKSLHRLSNNY